MKKRIKGILSSNVSQMVVVAAIAAAFVLVVRPGGQFAGASAPALTRDTIRNAASVAATGHRSGRVGAAHRLVLFSDFECPFCKKFEAVLAEVEQDSLPVEITFRHYPLLKHPRAMPAAMAAECAGEQGRFQQMRGLLFTQLDSLTGDRWVDLAREAGVADLTRFAGCLSSVAPRDRIRGDMEAAQVAKIDGTPMIVLDGRKLSRPPSMEELRVMLR